MTDFDKLLQDLLAQHGSKLAAALTQTAGFTAEQAVHFVPAAGQKVARAISDGGIDLQKLLGGDFGTLVGKIDVASLAKQVGIEVAKAQSGLAAMLPTVLQLLQKNSGGLEGILKGLGGGAGLGNLGKLAGKLFGQS